MSRGYSSFTGTGDVGEPIKFGQTSHREECCSFMLAIQKRDQARATWVKINVYGGNVAICKTRLRVGGNVSVKGEAMNRDTNGFITTEFRADEIVFHN